MRRDQFSLSHRPNHLSGLLTALRQYHIAILVFVTTLARMRIFFHPDEAVLGWRPADNASIALNYLRNGFHFLHPQIFWGGNGPGYVETEFPIVQYCTAVLYRIFGVHDLVAMIIPFFSAIGVVIVVYLIAAELFDTPTGLVAGIVVAVSPGLSMYSKTFNVDPSMLFFSVLGMYTLIRWVNEEKPVFFYVSALAVSMSILLKPTAMLLSVPIAYVFVRKYGRTLLKQKEVLLYGMLALIPPVHWYIYAHMIYLISHNTFGILSGGMLKLSTPGELTSAEFYRHILERVVVYQITPLSFLFFLRGCFVRHRESLTYVLLFWLLAVVAYVLVVGRGALWGENYLLPFIPPVALLTGVGFFKVISKIESRLHALNPRLVVWVGIAVVWLVSDRVSTLVYRQHDFMEHISEVERRSALAMSKVMEPKSLIIVVNPLMNDVTPETSMTPPDVFYFTGHRGWYLATSWLSDNTIEGLRAKGARYFVISSYWISDFRSDQSNAYAYLTSHYRTVVDSQDGLVVDLCGSKQLKFSHSSRSI